MTAHAVLTTFTVNLSKAKEKGFVEAAV